ncbi:MAG: DUF3341 domain-containing protein [Opitutales bacterium]
MKKTYGLIAAFPSTPELYHACEKVRDAGYSDWDAITPFPVHGLDAAMGLRRSQVPRLSLIGGIIGFCTGMTLIWWTDAADYPLIVGGKPLFSPMFAFPVSYELTILFTAFSTIIGMFILNRLPMHYHPVQKAPQLARLLDDRFHIVIEAADPKFNVAATRAFLASIGGQDIAELEE